MSRKQDTSCYATNRCNVSSDLKSSNVSENAIKKIQLRYQL